METTTPTPTPTKRIYTYPRTLVDGQPVKSLTIRIHPEDYDAFRYWTRRNGANMQSVVANWIIRYNRAEAERHHDEALPDLSEDGRRAEL